jgi:UrcA family protein
VETNMFSTNTQRSNQQRIARLALLAALAGSVFAAAAQAGTPGSDVASVKVAYGDLNLTSSQGSTVLDSRIKSAARAVCDAGDLDNRDLRAYAEERSCEQRAIARAVADVHSVQMAALAAASTPQG